jgi:exodeoxyribonuclease-3
VKFASWNVNSIRARQERLLALLERHDLDVVGLQETKVVPESFPHEELRAAGYECAVAGQKTYNGVAILARRELAGVATAFDDGGDDSEARLVAASVDGIWFVCVYVPNGQRVGSEKYAYKLEWMARLRRFLDKVADPSLPVVVFGDFNVAPTDIDVHDPEAWRDQVLCSDPERAALRDLLGWGLHDAFRHLNPDAVAYSWWDYRQLGFPKNRGLRIDHVLVTRPVLERLREVRIDRDERKGKQPSDHAPVLALLD